ncbi:hypothetical protein ACJMK2_002526 [Sinanodonta woodiana]|uniref:Uncharacterized protein n=1 Tax=Sinanodonta woodiana TaxID=1069815 RepID=A0ABD3XXB5_SINWO
MRNITLLLLVLVVSAVALSKNVRKRSSISTEDDLAKVKRLLEAIDNGDVDLDQYMNGDKEESPRMFVRFRWPWRIGKK